jgi:hypothetical protein
MRLNRTAWLRLIKFAIVCVVAILIITYAISRSLSYTRGPRISVFQPVDGSSIGASTVTIQGRADRINTLYLDGSPISMDQQGTFSEMMTVFPGSNIITLSAHDQFGRTTQTLIHLFGTVDLPIPHTATSSPATTTSKVL